MKLVQPNYFTSVTLIFFVGSSSKIHRYDVISNDVKCSLFYVETIRTIKPDIVSILSIKIYVLS